MINFNILFDFLNGIAPFGLQEEWDRSGVWIKGRPDVGTVWIGLEIEEFKGKADCLIIHHPPYLKNGSFLSKEKKEVLEFLNSKEINLVVMHTNADAARDSFVNFLLAKIGVEKPGVFKKVYLTGYRIVTFIPKEYVNPLLRRLKELSLSNLGFYTGCAYFSSGYGHFCALSGSNPFSGKAGECETMEEIRFEFMAKKDELEKAIRMIEEVHPYEEPVIEVYDVKWAIKNAGYGRVFVYSGGFEKLKNELDKIGVFIEDSFQVREKSEKVVILPGSGRSFLKDVIKYSPDTLITGDLGYHDKKDLYQHGINLIEVNHASVERFFVDWLEDKLLKQFGADLEIFSGR